MSEMLEPTNPSMKDQESTAPYNEEKARKVFGDEFVERLVEDQEEFCGDWWQLAKLFKYLEEDAELRPDGSTIKPEEHLRDWNEWRRDKYPYRDNPDFEYVHLEHATLSGANLEYANLQAAHLEYAQLMGTLLQHANLLEAHLEGAELAMANLEHAQLLEAHFEHADLAFATLEHADLRSACLEHANLQETRLEHADLRRVELKQANLDCADLSMANLRGASGILFNDNRVRDIDIEGVAPDPWSVLRRKYTGPWFFVHLLLLLVFFAPYLGRAAYLSATGKMEQWTIEKYAALGERLEEAPEPVRELSRAHAELKRRFDETHEERRAVWVLLGGKAGWGWMLPMVVIVYNFLRGYLTLRVSMLREAEERSQHSPALGEYYGMSHPIRDREGPESGWKRWHGWLGGWLGAIDAFFTGRPGWGNRFGETFSERKDPGVWGIGRGAWQWLSEAPLRLGLYRLHRIARLMFIGVVLVVGWHMWDWMRDTWVLVPKG